MTFDDALLTSLYSAVTAVNAVRDMMTRELVAHTQSDRSAFRNLQPSIDGESAENLLMPGAVHDRIHPESP